MISGVNKLQSDNLVLQKETLDVQQQKEKEITAPSSDSVVELDKFKRRLIRAVARLLLHEKKSEEDIWTDLKKETRCDCKLLWTRMRALTLKKLARLFAADDRVEALPSVARLSLTDWLLFDLVLVHQKIDLIGQDNPTKDPKYDPKPLVDLFELVKMFSIEGKSGDNLAEAWSSATLYYNNQGHQCSPMLLQRRWYQLKELTRAKFYDFWFAYRGTAKRLSFAEPHTPTPLQSAIARKYKDLVTKPFLEWEELIEARLITLPEEFEQKMLEKTARKRIVRKPTNDDAPDLVVIEPNIETIDLRLESDNDSEKSTEEKSPPPTEVKIKEEPQDMDIDIDESHIESPKKSKFQIVLESTALEFEKIDNMGTAELELMDDDLATEENEIEQAIQSTLRAQDDETVLPQITSVFGNVSDTSTLSNVNDKIDESVLATIENTSGVANLDAMRAIAYVEDTSVRGNVDDSSVLGSVDDPRVLGNGEDNNELGNVHDSSVLSNEGSNSVRSGVDDIVILGNVDDIAVLGNVNDTNVLGNEESTSVCSNVEDPIIVGNVHHKVLLGHLSDTSVPDIINATDSYDEGVTSILSSVNKFNENLSQINTLNNQISNTTLSPVNINDSDEAHIIEDRELEEKDKDPSENTQHNVMSIERKPNIEEYSFNVSNVIEDAVMDEESVDKKIEVDMKPDITSFSFGELSNDIKFVDDGIEFVDDGIAYCDEDSNCETKVKTEATDEEEDEDKSEETPKIDEKLFMCPIVYTVRLNDMGLFTMPFDHIKGTQLLEIVTTKSKPIKNVPVDKSTSEDDICDEDVITDNQKVKESSYLLQKPRSRSYNPIQLCKNPDFNTRLKRLTVGFFSSPRNRVLIKSCKPLTIDLSKAFESKLVSGTLYLKPSDHNVKHEIIEDTESRQNVSVLPSAMLAQSLIDNSKIGDVLPPYQNYFAIPKPPSDSGTTSERNKVINLPDISEIRRINQRLLTAEVTPIQVRNNTPQVPVSIVPALNTRTASVVKSATIPETDIDVPLAVDSRGPPKMVVISENSPDKADTGNNSSTERDGARVVKTYRNTYKSAYRKSGDILFQPANTHLAGDSRGPPKVVVISEDLDSSSKNNIECNSSTERNIPRNVRTINPQSSNTKAIDIYRSVQGKNSGRGRYINGKKVHAQKAPVVLWKPRPYRIESVPWLTKNSESSLNSKMGDTLLTIDTLNKMLYLLSSDKKETTDIILPKAKQWKKKKKLAARQEKLKSAQSRHEDSSDVQIIVETEEKSVEKPSERTKKNCKPKINIKPATNYPPDQREIQSKTAEPEVKDLQENDTEQPVDTEQLKDNNDAKKKFTDCCWSHQRMLQIQHSMQCIPPHDCSYPECTCCCRTLLNQFAMNEYNRKRALKQAECVNPDERVLEKDTTDSSENIQACVEIVVEPRVETPGQVPAEATVQVRVAGAIGTSVGRQVVDVDAPTNVATSSVSENEPIDLDAMDAQDSVPPLGSEVCVTTSTVIPPVQHGVRAAFPGTKLVSDPTFKILRGSSRTIVCPKKSSHASLSGVPSLNTRNFTLSNNNQSSPPSLRNILAAKKSKMPSRFTANLPTPSNHRPSSPPKNKEKIIFLNSKHISEKPTENPIFLGKNKILLTTVRFPPNLKRFEEAKQKLNASLRVPKGVSLICLPNGTVTFTTDHSVKINAAELAAMPAIVAAVEAQMNSSLVQLATVPTQIVPPKVMENEVVNLIDDDDDDATPIVNNENKNESREIAPVAEDTSGTTAIEVDRTNSGDNLSTDSSHVETENLADLSSKNITHNYTEIITENKQNISDDQKSVTDIQENDQELDHNKTTTSTSAELDQPEVPSKNGTTDPQEENNTESSKANKSKNILSDLMEMSGIFDEDITPTPEEILAEPAVPVVLPQAPYETPLEPVEIEPVLPAIPVSEETPVASTEPLATSEEPTPASVDTALASTGTELPPLHNFIPKSAYDNAVSISSVPPIVNSPVGALSPITSLYELKYACLNNGIFFKLDFETGYLVPINVCMKQHPKQSQASKATEPKATEPKAVIDLTDDDDSNKLSQPSPDKTLKSLLNTNHLPTASASSSETTPISSIVKPVKLFRALKPLKPAILRKLGEKKPLAPEKETNYENDKNGDHIEKRKQFLRNINLNTDIELSSTEVGQVNKLYFRKIYPKKDLVITDKIVGEAKEQPARPLLLKKHENIPQTIIESDDSSDDEPLAKKVRRKIENEAALALPMEVEAIEVEVADDKPTDVCMSDTEPTESETHYEHDLEPTAVEEEEEEEEETGEEENCILGV